MTRTPIRYDIIDAVEAKDREWFLDHSRRRYRIRPYVRGEFSPETLKAVKERRKWMWPTGERAGRWWVVVYVEKDDEGDFDSFRHHLIPVKIGEIPETDELSCMDLVDSIKRHLVKVD